MKNKQIFCLSLVLIFFIGIAEVKAQDSEVSGTVTDAANNDPLPGVNITVKGSPSVGTSTDTNGKYSLTVSSLQDTLVFSFVGYVTREIPINNRSSINIH